MRRAFPPLDARQLRDQKYEHEVPSSIFQNLVFLPPGTDPKSDEAAPMLAEGTRTLKDNARERGLEYGVYHRHQRKPLPDFYHWRAEDGQGELFHRGTVRYQEGDEQYFACSALRNYAVHLDMSDHLDSTTAFALLTFPSLLPDAVHVSVEEENAAGRHLSLSRHLEVLGSSKYGTPYLPELPLSMDPGERERIAQWERSFLGRGMTNRVEQTIASSLFGYQSQETRKAIVPFIPLPQRLRDLAFDQYHTQCLPTKREER